MKMARDKFCISTRGLSKDQKKDFAESLNEFVENKKTEFKEQKESDQDQTESEDSK